MVLTVTRLFFGACGEVIVSSCSAISAATIAERDIGRMPFWSLLENRLIGGWMSGNRYADVSYQTIAGCPTNA